MKSASRRRWRFLLLIATIVFLVGLVGWGALRYYLSSESINQQVRAQLEKMLGSEVRVASARVGLIGESTFKGVEVFDKDKPTEAPPWLSIGGVDTDLSALGMLRGRTMPTRLDVSEAEIHLRFKADGSLLTSLPSTSTSETSTAKLPRITLHNSKLTLNQQGRNPMVIQGVEAQLIDAGETLTLTGSVADPHWGDWEVVGTLNLVQQSVQLTLHTVRAEVTQKKLEDIPFVPPSVWQNVRAEGTTPAKVILRFQHSSAKTDVHYRVEATPTDAQVTVVPIDLTATQAHGNVVIEDGLVTLRAVAGQAAGGKVLLPSADLDFRKDPSRLQFESIRTENVALSKLPKSWGINNQIGGKLSGEAQITLLVPDKGPLVTMGQGKGKIDPATLAGFKTSEPIQLILHTTGERFRFTTDKKMASRILLPAITSVLGLSVAPPTEANPPVADPKKPAPPQAKPPVAPRKVKRIPPRPVAAISRRTAIPLSALAPRSPWPRLRSEERAKQAWPGRSLSLGLVGLLLGAPPKGAKPREPSYLEMNFSLKDVNLAELLQRLGVKVPVKIDGRLSFNVKAAIPLETVRDIKAYKAQGTATLSSLELAGQKFEQVAARLQFENGVLELEELSGKLPHPRRPTPGTFAGSARLQVDPLGDLNSNLTLSGIPLDQFLSEIPQTKSPEGIVSGKLKLRIPSAKFRDLSSWEGSGTLESPQLKLFGLTATKTAVVVNLARGFANLKSVQTEIAGTTIQGTGQLALSTPYRFNATAKMPRADLSALNQLVPDFKPPVKLGGLLQLSADLKGALSPLTLDASGSARATRLTLDRFTIDALGFDWAKAKEGIKVAKLQAQLYEGQVTGSALLPLSEKDAGSVDLDIKGVDARAVTKALPDSPVTVEGQVSGSVTGKASPAAPRRPRVLTSKVELSSKRLVVQGIPSEQLKGTLDYRGEKLTYNLEGKTLGGSFQIDGKYPADRGTRRPAPAPEKRGPGTCRCPPGSASRPRPLADGQLHLRNIQLRRLWPALKMHGTMESLDAIVSLSASFQIPEGGSTLPPVTGRYLIRDLRFKGKTLSPGLRGDLVLRSGILEIRNRSGGLGKGSIQGILVYDLNAARQGTLNLNLSRIPLANLLVLFQDRNTPVTEAISGDLSVRIQARTGAVWSGTATAILQKGRTYGVRLGEWRVPIHFRYTPSRNFLEMQVRNSRAQLGNGLAYVRGRLTSGSSLTTEGQIRFLRADVRTFLGSTTELVRGQITGTIDFRGKDMRSLNDLQAVARATLQQTQALKIPVLRRLAPFLTGVSQATTFRTGELEARLDRGIIRLRKLTLESTALQAIIQGRILLNGRLDLVVIAGAGPSINAASLGLVAVGAAVPVAVLVSGATFLANRVITLRVTGTVQRPYIRFQPLRILTEEAFRFFTIR